MSETPFYVTRMGRCFYERDVPALVEQLTRLNDVLERMVDRLDKNDRGRSADPGAIEEGS